MRAYFALRLYGDALGLRANPTCSFDRSRNADIKQSGPFGSGASSSFDNKRFLINEIRDSLRTVCIARLPGKGVIKT